VKESSCASRTCDLESQLCHALLRGGAPRLAREHRLPYVLCLQRPRWPTTVFLVTDSKGSATRSRSTATAGGTGSRSCPGASSTDVNRRTDRAARLPDPVRQESRGARATFGAAADWSSTCRMGARRGPAHLSLGSARCAARHPRLRGGGPANRYLGCGASTCTHRCGRVTPKRSSSRRTSAPAERDALARCASSGSLHRGQAAEVRHPLPYLGLPRGNLSTRTSGCGSTCANDARLTAGCTDVLYRPRRPARAPARPTTRRLGLDSDL